MNLTARNVGICHVCPHAPKPGQCKGKCPCGADPQARDIGTLAKAHECPMNLFPARGFGDTVAAWFKVIGVAWLVKILKPGCACKERQAALNRMVSYS